MNLSEVAIIYFSIGAAVGTHYFFKANRVERRRRSVRAKVMSVVLVWPMYLLYAAFKSVNKGSLFQVFASSPSLDSNNEHEVRIARKHLESMLPPGSETVGLYSWRETLDRYAGLSLADAQPFESRSFELLRHVRGSIQKTQVICLNRRNRERLKSHRNSARNEFLSSFARLFTVADDPGKAGIAAVEFVKLLNDDEAAIRIEHLVADLMQIRREIPVRELENRSWIPQEQ